MELGGESLIIVNDHLTMRPLKKEDMQSFWELAYKDAHPEWKKWDAPYFQHQALTYDDFITKVSTQYLEQDDVYGIFADGRLIGTVSYYWEHEPSNWLEAGIIIYDSTLWNRQYGTPCFKAWITHLFDSMSLVRVGFTTWSGNRRMMRLGEKLGMTLEARLRKCRFYQGEYYDSIRYGVLREEWSH